jgi:hypothetical protein
MVLAELRSSLDYYAKNKKWHLYIPLWLFGIYIFVKLLGFNMLAGLPIVLLIPYSFNFALHELAHIVTGFLPSLLTASAGSISELLLGTGLVIGAFYFRNYFASMFCLLWFDLACQSAGTYMADALPQRLPLVSLGGALSGQDPIHDWHFVFGVLHVLGASSYIGNSIRIIGHIGGLFGIAFAAWVIYKIAEAASVTKTNATEPKAAHVVATIAGLRGDKPIYPEPTRGPLAPHHDPSLDVTDGPTHDR